MKKIEQLCYSFVWNGIDRVKRNIIKAGRDKGGINGIDVKSFFYSIAVRQFEKSNNHLKLKFINSCPDITEDIKTHARSIIRKILMKQLEHNDILGVEDTKWILQMRADYFTKPNSTINHLLCKLGVESVSSISFESYSRKTSNSIRRSLPSKVILTIDRYLAETNLPCKTTLIVNNKEIEIMKIGSRILNEIIKTTLKKVVDYHPANRYLVNPILFGDIRHTWTNLWLIKNPTLRGIRLKVLHKDIWTQEKRFKLGITNSSSCDICGEPELVTHQLITCVNAKRLWTSVCVALGKDLLPSENISPELSLIKLMEVTNCVPFEIVKAVVFKSLIQIDRSHNINTDQLYTQIIYWLQIDMMANNNKIRNNKYLNKSYHEIINRLKSN